MITKEKKQYLKEYYQKNKEKHLEECKKRYQENREERLIWHKENYKNNIEKYKKQSHKYYLNHKEERMKKSDEYYKTHKEQVHKRNKERSKEVRLKVLTHYGNGKCACVGCGYSIFDALDLDHINNNGAENRPKYGYSWGTFWRSLVKNNYPEGYQTLCRNCNWLKHIENSKNNKLIYKKITL